MSSRDNCVTWLSESYLSVFHFHSLRFQALVLGCGSLIGT